MLGLFKCNPAPLGPAEIGFSLEIERPAREVYALIDWADPRNAKRAAGNQVRSVAGAPDRFELTMPMLGDLSIEIHVREAFPHTRYAYDCVIQPPLGHLTSRYEAYDIAPQGAKRCVVSLLTVASFAEGLSKREYTEEVATMTAHVQSTMHKLKLQAEHGAEYAKAIEGSTLL